MSTTASCSRTSDISSRMGGNSRSRSCTLPRWHSTRPWFQHGHSSNAEMLPQKQINENNVYSLKNATGLDSRPWYFLNLPQPNPIRVNRWVVPFWRAAAARHLAHVFLAQNVPGLWELGRCSETVETCYQPQIKATGNTQSLVCKVLYSGFPFAVRSWRLERSPFTRRQCIAKPPKTSQTRLASLAPAHQSAFLPWSWPGTPSCHAEAWRNTSFTDSSNLDSTHSGMNQDEPMLPLQGDLMVINGD